MHCRRHRQLNDQLKGPAPNAHCVCLPRYLTFQPGPWVQIQNTQSTFIWRSLFTRQLEIIILSKNRHCQASESSKFLMCSIPKLFFVYFRIFKHTIQFFQQINGKILPYDLQWDLYSWPLDFKSVPLTTRPVANLINTQES